MSKKEPIFWGAASIFVLAIVGIGWLARKFPRSIGGTIFAVTAVLLYVILAKGFTMGQITAALVVSVPLVTAGLCLIVGDRKDPDGDLGLAKLANISTSRD